MRDATGGEWLLVCEAHGVERHYARRAEAMQHLGAGDWCPACLLTRPLPAEEEEELEAVAAYDTGKVALAAGPPPRPMEAVFVEIDARRPRMAGRATPTATRPD